VFHQIFRNCHTAIFKGHPRNLVSQSCVCGKHQLEHPHQRTNIVAIENVATKIVGGNNKLCNENNFEARNNIATSYCSWLVKIVASAPSGCKNKWCNIKFVEARSEITSRYGSRLVTIIASLNSGGKKKCCNRK